MEMNEALHPALVLFFKEKKSQALDFLLTYQQLAYVAHSEASD